MRLGQTTGVRQAIRRMNTSPVYVHLAKAVVMTNYSYRESHPVAVLFHTLNSAMRAISISIISSSKKDIMFSIPAA
jgi:hypothetical protein